MKIAAIGFGYMVPVSGVCLTELGDGVNCLDAEPEKVDVLSSSDVPICAIAWTDVCWSAVLRRYRQNLDMRLGADGRRLVAGGLPPRSGWCIKHSDWEVRE